MAVSSPPRRSRPADVVTFLVRAELNDFLPVGQRERPVERAVPRRTSLKDAIEALGVPHVEVGRVVVDGVEVGLDEPVGEARSVEVFPHQGAAEDGHPARFVLDGHLGRLARYLRILGIDAAYDPEIDDAALAERAAAEDRILLTRDVGLLKRSRVTRGYWLRADRPDAQLAEVVRRYGLLAVAKPFGRCLRCNADLEAAPKAEVVDRLPPRTRLEFNEFRRCPSCDRIYWKGSHYDRMRRLLARLEGPG